jgi:hypothetical protein
MIVFAPYSPTARVKEQWETREFVNDLSSPEYEDDAYSVIRWACSTPTDYANGLNRLWGVEDIIIIEHDIVPTYTQMLELLICKESAFCAWDYVINEEGKRWSEALLTERGKDRLYLDGTTQNGHSSSDANHASFGFCRIDKEAQGHDVPIVHWKELAYVVSKSLPDVHVHGVDWPVKHNHYREA